MKRFPLSKFAFLLAILLSLVLLAAHVSAAAAWNGETWRIVKSPNGTYYNDLLSGMVTISKHDVWAVGATDVVFV